jgi:tetratricopeptide (TPR) repeat protein
MDWRDQGAEVFAIARRAAEATEQGVVRGSELLTKPVSTWRRLMRAEEDFRSFGTLQFLLRHARSEFETLPSHAFEITSAVVQFVEHVDGPSRLHVIGLRGLAWKEHANACEVTGDLRAARAAAERAVAIYGEAPVLLFDQARARLVLCKIFREMGDADMAIELARQCIATFADFGDLSFVNMAKMVEAGVLFTSKRFGEALQIFVDVMAQAELDGDRLTVARCLQCAAPCARELGDLDAARDFFGRALRHFEALEIPTEANRVRWGLALTLGAEGKVAHAISELFKARAIFLSLGMNSQAASVALDVVRFKHDIGDDVHDLCAELVPLFTAAGMTQNAIEALAYLREEESRGALTTGKIHRLRKYFDALPAMPTLRFATTVDQEEG